MNLTLSGHDDRYAVEQLLLSLFPEDAEVTAVSGLTRESGEITVSSTVQANGVSAANTSRMREADETVRLRRQLLQQSMYLAAKQLLPQEPAWGALAGVRPTKITTKHLLEGGTAESANALLRDVYFVTPSRRAIWGMVIPRSK